MKKQLICLLVTLSAFLIFAQGALATNDEYELVPLSCVQEEMDGLFELNANIVIAKNHDIKSGTLMLVYYNENGTAIDVDTCSLKSDFPMQAGQIKVYSIKGKIFDTPVKSIKAMIWDEISKLTPLAEAATLEPGFTKCAEFTGMLTVDLYHDSYDSYLRVRESIYSSKIREYPLTPNVTQVYINGREFATINNTNCQEMASILRAAEGNVLLHQNLTVDAEEYDKIFVNIYGIAKVSDVIKDTDTITIRLASQTLPTAAGLSTMGSSFTVYDEDLTTGYKIVSVTRNGIESNLSSLAAGDIIAVKYDVISTIDNSDEISILATNDTVTGRYTSYDSGEDLYEIDGTMYEAGRTLDLIRGSTYIFKLDPFGRLFSFNEDPSSKNYAIVEKYNDVSMSGNSSEYDFIDIVTLTGEKKRLYIENTTSAMVNANAVMAAINTPNASGVNNFVSVPLANRVIEYSVKTSTGRVNNLSLAATTSFSYAYYNPFSNRLHKLLSANAKILDASAYVDAGYSAIAADYKTATLSDLSENTEYSGFLVHQDSNNEYHYLVLTIGSTKRYAIIEKYNDVSESGEYSYNNLDFFDVVTFDGEPERLYINSDENVTDLIASIPDGKTSNGVTSFAGTSPEGRVIEYISQGMDITDVNKASVTSFTGKLYNKPSNAIGDYALSDTAKVFVATDYINAGTDANVDDYYELLLASLSEETEYSGFVLFPDSGSKYSQLIITSGTPEYTPTTNYAIIEKYNDVSISGNSSEFDFIDVVTLEGESKKLYIDSTISAMTNASSTVAAIKGSPLNVSGIDYLTDIPIHGRVIEYTLKASTGRVNNMSVAVTETFTAVKYNPFSNRLYKPLSADAKVLNASQYISNGTIASASDYKMLSLSSLTQNVNYSGFLVNKNSNNLYTNVVLTADGPKYHGASDFAVAAMDASTASGAIVNDEDVYTLRVMKDGASTAEKLYISPAAMVYYNSGMNFTQYGSYTISNALRKGSAFFYTVDDYGLVDRIDVVFQGGKTFDQFRDAPVVNTPDTQMSYNVIESADWYVNPDKNGLHPNNERIQIFAAPVLQTTDGNVSFSHMGTDANGTYVDTNVEYWYGIADDANIYYYDMSETAPTNYMAFSKGQFTGIELSEVSWDGKAYINDVAGEMNFDGMVEVAFVMVVDGTVTNALVIGEDPGYTNVDHIKATSYVNLTESKLTIKKSGLLRASEYTLTQPNPYSYSGGTDLYVNEQYYTTISSSNISEVQMLLNLAHGDITISENPSIAGEYNKIMIDVYGLAKVNQVISNSGSTVVRLTSQTLPYPLPSMGSQFTVYDEEVADGTRVVTVTKNDESSELSSLTKGDIIAIRYDMSGTVDQSDKIEILATDKTVTGMYTRYDDVNDKYEISGVMYEAASWLSIARGTTYTFALDPFGRLFSSEEVASAKNYAIVEKYNDVSASGNSSEYDYLDVVTLTGEKKRLYIDNSSSAMSNVAYAIEQIKGSSLNMNGIENFAGTPPANRVIEYNVKTSTGRVNYVQVASVYSFSNTKYNSVSNRLAKPLSATATVLDATAYVYAGYSATASDYKTSSLSALSERNLYDGFLIHQNNINQYEYVVLTVAGAKYTGDSNFAVATENANLSSGTIIEDEDVYTLRVMKDGAAVAEKLLISPTAMVYSSAGRQLYPYNSYSISNVITKGSAFFYTVDDNGWVDRIDVVFEGGKTFDQYRDAPAINLPDTSMHNVIVAYNWFITCDDRIASGIDETVQLFAAPVVFANDNNVSFSAIEHNQNGVYVDTNIEYVYSISPDANIYKYNMTDNAPINHTAFAEGSFRGIDLKNISDEGHAYLNDVYGEHNFDGELQVAFVMAVDGVITNALIFDEYTPSESDGDENNNSGDDSDDGSSVVPMPNYAIIEKYNDVSISGNASEYDFIDIVTLDGQSKRLLIDATDAAIQNAAETIQAIKGSALSGNGIENFTGTDPAGRVIEYTVKSTTGRANSIRAVSVHSFHGDKYNQLTNRLSKSLAENAVVLDATAYIENGAAATAHDYAASSLSALSDKVNYAGFLVHQNEDNKYAYVVITIGATKYHGASDFAVAAANASAASGAIVDDEDIYTLRVMKDGNNEAEVLNIAMDAIVYYNAGTNNIAYSATSGVTVGDVLKKGSVFFYTVDKNGLVDRIDVVFEGGKTFDQYRDAPIINKPDTTPNVIESYNWSITCDENLAAGLNETIQLFAAPVICATDTTVSFSYISEMMNEKYVDTDIMYDYGIAQDANVYYYDMSASAPSNYTAFSGGDFVGIDLGDTDPYGRAWLADVAGETNFDGLIQIAFVMVVDGTVTNALIIGE